MEVVFFDSALQYAIWAEDRIGEVKIIHVTAFGGQLVITYEVN